MTSVNYMPIVRLSTNRSIFSIEEYDAPTNALSVRIRSRDRKSG